MCEKFRNILFNFFHSIIQHYVFTLHFHHGFDWFLTSWKCYESMFWKYFEHQNVLVLTWTLTTLIGKSHRHQESWFLTPPQKITPQTPFLNTKHDTTRTPCMHSVFRHQKMMLQTQGTLLILFPFFDWLCMTYNYTLKYRYVNITFDPNVMLT